MSNYVLVNGQLIDISNELNHYGVKGMRWGVRRRYYNEDGSLNAKGVKKYAKKGYAQDSYRSNKTIVGKAFDTYTRAHKTEANARYSISSKKQNEARAKQYLADKQKSKNSTSITKRLSKTANNQMQKRAEKAQKRNEAIKKTTDRFGTGGVALSSYASYRSKKVVKGLAASIINQSANAYISNNKTKKNITAGIDMVRKTAIAGLSISSDMDRLRAASDIGKSYMYKYSK